ncbi:MAG TPA: hypothetical protein VJH89_03085 [Patescibacteria group bacterium]|nr:hypothetical protein [Patescibacteria group bacterium]
MTSQQHLNKKEKTHTVSVSDGGNIDACLKSLKSVNAQSYKLYYVSFQIKGHKARVRLIITSFEFSTSLLVKMKGGLQDDVGATLSPLCCKLKKDREFVFTAYNLYTRTGWLQIPEHYFKIFGVTLD